MITRVSRKLEIFYRFQKAPDQAYVSAWLSVQVPAKKKRFNQTGQFFQIENFWDAQTIRRLEELYVRTDTLNQALEEIARSEPTVPTIGKQKDLLRSGMVEAFREQTSPYLAWEEQFKSADLAKGEAWAEGASLIAEMVRQRSDLPEKLLAYVIPLRYEEQADERAYALYHSAIWRSDRNLSLEQWKILVDRFLEQEDAELAAALSPPALGESESARERIAPEIRCAVWIRDQGKCARCGSREKLEYDHIVPVSRGGSNTERNIELLCEFHNRAKSNAIS